MTYLDRVTYEYSDGTKKYIDSQELEKWLQFNAIVAQFAETHGVNPPWHTVKWRNPDKIKHY